MSPHPQTGPKTDEGKARSAQNAIKHGLLCTNPIVTPETQAQFDRLASRLLTDMVPGTAAEVILYKEIVTASWNLHRIGVQRQAIFTETKQDPLNCTDPAVQARYDRLDRYHARNERTLHRTIKLYQQLQTSRGALAIDKDALPANTPANGQLHAPVQTKCPKEGHARRFRARMVRQARHGYRQPDRNAHRRGFPAA